MDLGFVDHILNLAKQYPDLAAGILGVALSICATQFFKKMLPDSLPDGVYRRLVQLIGFGTGWFFAHGAWVLLDPTSNHFERVYASAGCGFASPALYTFVSGYMSSKFPWWDKYFSGRPNA